ncbi:MAG: 3-hydroxyacyl-CoA dehydrogenase family protein, partial [Ginsengibacter sp.]
MITTVAIVGAGTMGNGISHVFAQHGFKVNLIDVSQPQLDKGIAVITKNLDRQISKNTIPEEIKIQTLKNITTLTSLAAGVQDADLVVEAATENIELKLKIFKQIDEAAPANCIMATNTSSISITKIASVTKRPQQVIG